MNTSVFASYYGTGDLVVGNIVGSETAQITLAIAVAGIAARGGRGGITVGAVLRSNITDPIFSLGVGAPFFENVVDDMAAIHSSLAYMFVVSVAVLGLFYWRRGLDRKAAVACLLLCLPSFLFV